jgi:hypothetical protein
MALSTGCKVQNPEILDLFCIKQDNSGLDYFLGCNSDIPGDAFDGK